MVDRLVQPAEPVERRAEVIARLGVIGFDGEGFCNETASDGSPASRAATARSYTVSCALAAPAATRMARTATVAAKVRRIKGSLAAVRVEPAILLA